MNTYARLLGAALLAAAGTGAAGQDGDKATTRLGRLTVCVIEAQSLQNLDEGEWFGAEASDPYATVKVVGAELCSTVVRRDSADAVWNHCCDFGLVPQETSIHVVVTDMDDNGDDDLVGLACTSVHGGTRWLDLIRSDSPTVSGSVKVSVVFQYQSAAGAPAIPKSEFMSVNSTSGAEKVSCPSGFQLTDCTCLPTGDESACYDLAYDDASSCSSATASSSGAQLGARCIKTPTSVSASFDTSEEHSLFYQPGQVSTRCSSSSTLTGCIGAIDEDWDGAPDPEKPLVLTDSTGCAVIADDDAAAVSAFARCGTFEGSQVGFVIDNWRYQSLSKMEEPALAYCPVGFDLVGCACRSDARGVCGGALLTPDGGCAARFAPISPSSLPQLLLSSVSGLGIFAQARCLWLGTPESLLILPSDEAAAAQATACRPLAEKDAQFERERKTFVQNLRNTTGFDWQKASSAWWEENGVQFDFEEVAGRPAPSQEEVAELMKGLGVQVPQLPQGPEDLPPLPEDGPPIDAPVDALKAKLGELPLGQLSDAASRLKGLLGRINNGGDYSPPSPPPRPPPHSKPLAVNTGAQQPGSQNSSSGGSAGTFFGGMALAVGLMLAAVVGFLVFRYYHERKGVVGRPMLSQELGSSTASSFVPPNLVSSPLQNAA